MSRKEKSYYSELIARCRDGDEASWQELIDLVAPVIFSVTGRLRLTRDESFDIFGQVSGILVEHLDELKSPSRLLSYVATITKNRVYNYFRRSDRTERLSPEIVEQVPESSEHSPEHKLEQEQLRITLLDAMTELSERDYKLLWALYFDPDEPTYADIGRKLNMPESSIGPTRARALDRLAAIIKNRENPST